MRFYLVIYMLFYSQTYSYIDAAGTLDDAVQQKLKSIQQYLDSMSDVTVFDYIFRVNRGVGLNLFQGDIKGYNLRQAMMRTAITNHQQLWNTRVVPYIIDSSFDSIARKDIMAAIDEYHAKTCIRFVPRSSEPDYVHFKQISGCYSNIGRVGGAQDISLMGACLKKGTAIHEMMHALGFWHEQSRPDRDSWVQVIQGNIQSGKEYNFDKLSTSEADTLGVQYDYGSVMHYSRYAFSKNGNPTILPTRQTDAELGQREGLSDQDVLRIRKLYGCDIDAPKTTVKVEKPTSPKPPATTRAPVTAAPTTRPPPLTTQRPTQPPVQTQPPQTKPPVTQPPKTQPPQPTTQQEVTTKKGILTTQAPQTIGPKQTSPAGVIQTEPVTAAVKTYKPTTKPSAIQTTAPTDPTPAPTFRPVAPAGWTSWSEWSPCDMDCTHSRYRFCLNYDAVYCPGDNKQIETCHSPCKPTVSLGCWKTDKNNLSIPSVEGKDITLKDNYKGRRDAVDRCRNYAATHGYTTFALYDRGMCLAGPDAESQFRAQGISNGCDYTQTGASESINVYSFNTDVDGEWSLWTSWGPCTKACGTGRQHRYRRCENPPPRDVDGEWSLWTGWGPCTKACGTGRQHRYRRCDNPPPRGNGAQCSGNSEEIAVCYLQPCIVPAKCGTKFHAGGPGSTGLIWVRDYENFMECEYEIATGDPLATISIYIQELDVEYSRGCIYDRIELYDGRSRYSPLVGTFCGKSVPGAFESSSRYVFMKFVSDETNTGRGYTIFYSINSRSRKACVKPPAEAHARISLEGNMVGNRAWYMCEPGYKLVGHSPITCLDQPGFALWDDHYPRCVHMRKRIISKAGSLQCLQHFDFDICGPHSLNCDFINHGVFNREVCTFEDSLCGLKTDPTSTYNWVVKRPTNVSNQTSNQDRGNYLYVESTPVHTPEDVARVRLTSTDYSTSHCMYVMYKIDGGDLATLNIYTSPSIQTDRAGLNNNSTELDGEPSLLLTATGHQENVWIPTQVTINVVSPFTITFEAVLGEEIGSSISIDDILLQPGPCSNS